MLSHVIDDLAALIPVFNQFQGRMVLMPVGHKDQIRGKIVSISGIWVDIDHFPFPRNDPQAPVSLIQDLVVPFSHGGSAAQQKQRKRQNTAQRPFHHVVPLLVFSYLILQHRKNDGKKIQPETRKKVIPSFPLVIRKNCIVLFLVV